jgi:serine/threonine protein phosphatase PrpC
MKVYAHSEQGKRDYQQDRYLVKNNLVAVCDGMGGHANGELAAEAGIDRLSAINFNEKGTPCQLMLEAVRLANKDCELSDDNRGSTLIAVHVDEEKRFISLAHIGDSRIYFINKNKEVLQLTVDHAVLSGGLTSCLGSATRIDIDVVKFEKGDCVLLVSDGVSGAYSKRDPENPYRKISLNYLMVKEIDKALKEGWNPAEHLCHDAIARGSTDNCTAVLVEL